jgi:hypothetical protein
MPNIDELFETFYRVYPRHENPVKAREEFKKCGITANDLPQILDWIEKAKRSSQWQERDKIPYPSTFLHQKRWKGDPPPVSTGAAPKDQIEIFSNAVKKFEDKKANGDKQTCTVAE